LSWEINVGVQPTETTAGGSTLEKAGILEETSNASFAGIGERNCALLTLEEPRDVLVE
jgi:hypothetical protein